MFTQSRSQAVCISTYAQPRSAARYGIDVGAIQDVIETAIGENNITTTIEGRRRFPVRVRYAPQYRRDPQDLANVLVTGATGTQIPLGQVADIRQVSGPAMINSENGLLEVSVLLQCTRARSRRCHCRCGKSHPRQSQNASRLLLQLERAV